MTPVYWLILGVALIVAEAAAPTMVSMFFGLSAMIMALLVWVVPGIPPWLQWLLFVLLSVGLLFVLRRLFRNFFPQKSSHASGDQDRDIVGKHAVVTQRIESGRPGRIELRGAGWPAEAGETLEPGTPVKVVKQESITLTVERL